MSDNTYNVIKPHKGVPIKAWTKGVPVEEAAQKQLVNVAQMPFIYKWVAAMPDMHWGIGATVGSVIPTKGAIIPAAVGVDIGCGMMAVKTSLNASQLPDNLFGIREAIEQAVPHGRTDNGGKNDREGSGHPHVLGTCSRRFNPCHPDHFPILAICCGVHAKAQQPALFELRDNSRPATVSVSPPAAILNRAFFLSDRQLLFCCHLSGQSFRLAVTAAQCGSRQASLEFETSARSIRRRTFRSRRAFRS